jgi:PKD repeat protein
MDGRYFADFDNDGDLDIVANGRNLLRNDGNDVFSIISDQNYNVNSASYWADYDNDGDLDYLYKSDTSKIFRNDGAGIFTDIKAFKEQIKYDDAENTLSPWCDFDNDGDLDLLLFGLDHNSEPKIYLYENIGLKEFINTNINLKAVAKGNIEWIDYNNDGYMDIMASGTDFNGSVTTNLYKNNGNGNFSLINTGFPNLFNGKFSWGDYDADGDDDLIIAGSKIYNAHDNLTGETKIFRNDGNDHFTDISARLQLFFSGTPKWIDFDNDGDLDIVMHGYTSNYVSKALHLYYENRGNDQFTEVFRKESFETVLSKSFSLGDYDNDGDIDYVLFKRAWEDYSSLYRNNYNKNNDKPQPPVSFGVKREGTKTILFWKSGSDTETPHKALKYNIRIGTSPGASDIINPQADLTTGFIKMPDIINCADTFKILENIPLGKYYYSVQSIDNMHTGSEFSPEQSFDVIEPFSILNIGVPTLELSYIKSGDYDNDGDYDFIITGKSNWWSNCITKIFTNNGDSTFTESGIELIQINGNAEWGDYDNDNDLDLLVNGSDDNKNSKTRIYRNDGNGKFTDIGFDYTMWTQSLWTDIDNDGDLDIISAIRTVKNYGNDSLSYFNDYNQTNYADFLALADWDKDNDIDVSIITPSTRLFLNDNGIFNQMSNQFFNIKKGNVNWFDYNNDSYPDLIITGQDTTYKKQTLIYKNTGTGNFVEISPDLRAVIDGSLICGDYNGDGNSDIVMAGFSSDFMLKLYENNSFEGFKDVYTNQSYTPGNSILAWTDFNNDGYLDILTNYSKIFSNNSNTEKIKPKAPKNLQTEISGFEVIFTWDKPDINKGYSYNIRLGTTPNGTEIISPMADVVTGKRLILDMGNTQLNNSWKIKNLKAAQLYYWSVQAVDASFQGGEWSPEQTFITQYIFTDFKADTVCHGSPTAFTDLSVSPLGEISSWKWDFGDGSTLSVQNPVHTYPEPGKYDVTLTVTLDSLSFSNTKEIIVKQSPSAKFKYESIPPNRMLVTLTNTSDTVSLDIIKWLWDFGDGKTFSGKDPQTHGYQDIGIKKISLAVEAENGCKDTNMVKIDICDEILPKPELYSRGPTVWYLISSVETAKYYKWYLNDKLILGADKYLYIAKQISGIYRVAVSDRGNCYISSDEIKIPSGITGIDDSNPFEDIRIYPNPTPGLFTVEMDNSIFGELNIDIFTQNGSKTLNIKFQKTTEHFQAQIDLSGQSKGMYLINLAVKKYFTSRKILVK